MTGSIGSAGSRHQRRLKVVLALTGLYMVVEAAARPTTQPARG